MTGGLLIGVIAGVTAALLLGIGVGLAFALSYICRTRGDYYTQVIVYYWGHCGCARHSPPVWLCAKTNLNQTLYRYQRIYITRRTDSNPHRLKKSQLTQPLPPAL